MFKIIDDFLDIDKLKHINDIVHSEEVDWKIGKPNINSEQGNFQAMHEVIDKGEIVSPLYGFMVDYIVGGLQKKYKKDIGVNRFRINLFSKSYKNNGLGYHKDLIDNDDFYSLLLYLEDSDGKTDFKDVQLFNSIKFKSVDSFANRALIFPSSCEHQTLMHTDITFRTNINMNFKFDDE